MTSEVKTWVFRSKVDGTEVMIPLSKASSNQEAHERLAFLVNDPKAFKLVEVISLWPSSLYAK